MSDRLYNPRYREKTGQDWKYNLYYFQIDLASGHVMNFEGETMKTPIDVDYADQNCLIWDTEWRGSGVPPSIVLDEKGEPAGGASPPSFVICFTVLTRIYAQGGGHEGGQKRIESSQSDTLQDTILLHHPTQFETVRYVFL